MAFKFSNAFKSSETPRDFYEELNKNIYEQSFENAPNYYAVDCPTPFEYEYPFGSNKWHRVECRVDNIVLPNTGTKMKKFFTALVLIFVFNILLFAEENIAVFPFDNKSKQNYTLTEFAEN